MSQDPPVLQPIDEKEFFNNVDNYSSDKLQIHDYKTNGYMTNGSGTTSPPMPVLYQADREPLNIQDIFSALASDPYDANNIDHSVLEPRKDSDSLFEKMYKAYSNTFINSSIINDPGKDFSLPQERAKLSELNNQIAKEIILNENEHTVIIKESEKAASPTLESKPKVKQHMTKRSLKRRLKNSSFTDQSTIKDEDIKKLGIKTLPTKRKHSKSTSNKVKSEPHSASKVKEQSDNKYLQSPYITLRNRSPTKKQPIQNVNVISKEYEIINPSIRSHARCNIDYQASLIYRPNMKLLNNFQNLAAHPCICAFCGQMAEFLKLGSLYGPYFIDTESIPGLPLTCIFPSDDQQNSVIGISGKSAIKTDKNGGLKMVIQSTRNFSNRNNLNKKTEEDYRVTWEGEVWFHRECILWAPCTYLRGDCKVGGLEEALKMSLNAECCICHRVGAILNCTTKNCEKNFHYYCAASTGCKLNHGQFSILCNRHKEK